MRATDSAVEVLRTRGEMTSERVADFLPRLTVRQVQKALRNASKHGRCHFKPFCERSRGGKAGMWFFGPKDGFGLPEPEDKPEPAPDAPRGRYGIGRVSSVWDLGRINAPG